MRSEFDRKNAALVLYALKIDWLEHVDADPEGTAVTEDVADMDLDKYDTIFDDFHYDIGHGKGTGEGEVDTARVEDGRWTEAPAARGPVGDYETDIGAPAHAWEMPGSKSMRYY